MRPRRLMFAVLLLSAVTVMVVGYASAANAPRREPVMLCALYQPGACPLDHPTPFLPSPTTQPPAPEVSVPLNATEGAISEAPVSAPPATTGEGAVSSDCWMDVARQVGWPEHLLPHLSMIVHRESRCDPTVHADRPWTSDNSYGLLQINTIGDLWPAAQRLCGLTDRESLFDPAVNLSCGWSYFRAMGWQPWGG